MTGIIWWGFVSIAIKAIDDSPNADRGVLISTALMPDSALGHSRKFFINQKSKNQKSKNQTGGE